MFDVPHLIYIFIESSTRWSSSLQFLTFSKVNFERIDSTRKEYIFRDITCLRSRPTGVSFETRVKVYQATRHITFDYHNTGYQPDIHVQSIVCDWCPGCKQVWEMFLLKSLMVVGQILRLTALVVNAVFYLWWLSTSVGILHSHLTHRRRSESKLGWSRSRWDWAGRSRSKHTGCQRQASGQNQSSKSLGCEYPTKKHTLRSLMDAKKRYHSE